MYTNTIELIGLLYDTVTDRGQWDAFLGMLSLSLSAQAARMRIIDNRSSCYSVFAGNGHDNDFDTQYARHFHKVDLWNPALARGIPGEVFLSHELTTSSVLLNAEIYNDFYRRYDMFYGMGGNIAKDDHLLARIGVHRSQSQGPFGEEERRLLQGLMPHMIRAFKLGAHLDSLNSLISSLQDALYHAPHPFILIDENGLAALVNRRAEALLENELGLAISHGRLTLANTGEQHRLHELLQQAVATGANKGSGIGGALPLYSPEGNRRYNLLITPYPDRAVAHMGLNRRICAAVFIHDTQQVTTLPSEALMALYDLTPAEVRLATGIVEGLSPAEAAEQYGLSVHTTRSQLRSIFNKTGTQRQADLVKLLLGLTH